MTSPERMLDTDICVIGAGAAGLSVAAGAVQKHLQPRRGH